MLLKFPNWTKDLSWLNLNRALKSISRFVVLHSLIASQEDANKWLLLINKIGSQATWRRTGVYIWYWHLYVDMVSLVRVSSPSPALSFWRSNSRAAGNPSISLKMCVFPHQDVLRVGWKMDSGCITQTRSKKRKNKVSLLFRHRLQMFIL